MEPSANCDILWRRLVVPRPVTIPRMYLLLLMSLVSGSAIINEEEERAEWATLCYTRSEREAAPEVIRDQLADPACPTRCIHTRVNTPHRTRTGAEQNHTTAQTGQNGGQACAGHTRVLVRVLRYVYCMYITARCRQTNVEL